jgi:hypothetical protein
LQGNDVGFCFQSKDSLLQGNDVDFDKHNLTTKIASEYGYAIQDAVIKLSILGFKK